MESCGGGSKSSTVDSLGNEVGSKLSMADTPEKQSCTTCLSSGACRYHSDQPNQQLIKLSGYSSVCEDAGKQEQQLHAEGHKMGSTSKRLNVGQQKEETEGVRVESHFSEPSTHGSSACYGGPAESYGCVKETKKPINKITPQNSSPVEETVNLSDPEVATRGDWWKGSLYY